MVTTDSGIIATRVNKRLFIVVSNFSVSPISARRSPIYNTREEQGSLVFLVIEFVFEIFFIVGSVRRVLRTCSARGEASEPTAGTLAPHAPSSGRF